MGRRRAASRSLRLAFGLSLMVLAGAGASLADDAAPEELSELTIRLITDADALLPAAVTHRISLPLKTPGRAESTEGSSAEAASAEERRDDGLDRAADVRDHGRALGEELSETARENREAVGLEP